MTTVLHNPDWPEGLEAYGIGQDTRNLADHFKYWTNLQVRKALAETTTELVVAVINLSIDYNISTILRSCNAFNARTFWVIGKRKWDKRGAVGTYTYTDVQYSPDPAPVFQRYRDEGYHIICVDNIPNSVCVDDHVWHPKTLLVFGSEGLGIDNKSLSLADKCIYIPQIGSCRSLNTGAAAAIMINSYRVGVKC